MRYLTPTICLTLAVLLGSAASAPNGEQRPKIASGVVAEKPKSGLGVLFTQPEVPLRSGPGVRFPMTEVVKKAIGKNAVLLKQKKSWGKILFEGKEFWVHLSALDRLLRPSSQSPFIALFKVSDVNLQSGPGVRFPVKKVLKDAKGRRAVPFDESGHWVRIVFDKHPYWVHSSLIQRDKKFASFSKSTDQGGNYLTFFQEQKKEAAAGDPKSMNIVGGIYGRYENLHLQMSYMWLSLAIENSTLADKKKIQNHLEKYIIQKLRDSDIASAEKRIKRCKESKYRDCGETSMKVFQEK
jgi:uncharacterized protein YraI